MSRSNALSITLNRLGGLLIFLILLAIANILYINNSIYLGIVGFLNLKLWIIIVFSFLLYLGELFFVFGFPLNFPAPIFNAFGGIILVDFIFDIIVKVGDLLNTNMFVLFRGLELIVIIFVFILILIIGYVRVFGSIGRKSRKRKEMKNKEKQEWDWKDVKKEIKQEVNDVKKELKETFNKDEEKPKKKTSSKKKK